MSRYLVPLIAGGFLIFAGFHVLKSQTPHTQSPPPAPPARSPFAKNVAGSGIVEPRSENVEIGADVAGVVAELYVMEGQQVRPGDPLFRLDTRDIEAEITISEAALDSANASLQRLQQMPRPEEVPPMEAAVAEAKALERQARDAFERRQRLQQQGASTAEDLTAAREQAEAATSQRRKAEADTALLLAGAWKADIAIARAAVTRARAELARQQVELSRHLVAAPDALDAGTDDYAWEVLQINVRPGEYVSTPPATPMVVLGDIGPRRIRVDIDEHDLPRFEPGGKAVAYPRGDGSQAFPLRFVRIEPFVIPKRSLTGDTAGRVDTRVLQVIFEFEDPMARLYVGQQMDVFLASPGSAEDSPD